MRALETQHEQLSRELHELRVAATAPASAAAAAAGAAAAGAAAPPKSSARVSGQDVSASVTAAGTSEDSPEARLRVRYATLPNSYCSALPSYSSASSAVFIDDSEISISHI